MFVHALNRLSRFFAVSQSYSKVEKFFRTFDSLPPTRGSTILVSGGSLVLRGKDVEAHSYSFKGFLSITLLWGNSERNQPGHQCLGLHKHQALRTRIRRLAHSTNVNTVGFGSEGGSISATRRFRRVMGVYSQRSAASSF